VALIGHDQIETYCVIPLTGEARREMLPLNASVPSTVRKQTGKRGTRR
jgi:hypothetical protein